MDALNIAFRFDRDAPHDAPPEAERPTAVDKDPAIADDVHVPVLLREILSILRPEPGATVVDATVGAAGHALALARATQPGGRVIGIDRDEDILEIARERLRPFGESATLAHARAEDIDVVLAREGIDAVDAVLLDLGLSSLQIDRAERGFSFDKDGPLDMRMDARDPVTAADIVNREREAVLARILFEYGEERYARRIASAIARARARRPIRRTLELSDVIARAVPSSHGVRFRIHPATRTFQALRIAVNDELGGIRRALPKAVEALRAGGRLAVISFHSLEDRIVKQFLREESQRGRLRVLTRKPIVPDGEEVLRNPRSRSARLRAAERVGVHRVEEERS